MKTISSALIECADIVLCRACGILRWYMAECGQLFRYTHGWLFGPLAGPASRKWLAVVIGLVVFVFIHVGLFRLAFIGGAKPAVFSQTLIKPLHLFLRGKEVRF